jgi:hypothetical protein
MLNFSMYQSGVDLKCPYSNRPLKPSTPLIGLRNIFLVQDQQPSSYTKLVHAFCC